MDWYSRYVISWEISISLEIDFCICALEKALQTSKPKIFNSDQGSQFTSSQFTGILLKNEVRVSHDGRGKFYDNIFIERLWRSVKWEEVYLKEYQDVYEATEGIRNYFRFYNEERLHQSLGYRPPRRVYLQSLEEKEIN